MSDRVAYNLRYILHCYFQFCMVSLNHKIKITGILNETKMAEQWFIVYINILLMSIHSLF
jgi:hypothetical protein